MNAPVLVALALGLASGYATAESLATLLPGGIVPDGTLPDGTLPDATTPDPVEVLTAHCGGTNGRMGCCGDANQCSSGCNEDHCTPNDMCDTCRQSQYYGSGSNSP